MKQQQLEITLRKCHELMKRTLKDHSYSLDANRTIDFMEGIEEIEAVLEMNDAGVAKLVDAVGLGPAAARRGGSSPSARTTPSTAELLDAFSDFIEGLDGTSALISGWVDFDRAALNLASPDGDMTVTQVTNQ